MLLRALVAGARHCIRVMSAVTTQKPEVVFILGGPGAGKGTLCRYIVEHYGYAHLSAGDLLREERAKLGSEYGELIETHIRNGTIVPVEITCSLIDRAMQTSGNPHHRFLIDGFPRNQDNLDGWNKVMADKIILKGVIFCECSQEVCTQRCLKRGASGSGRSDDNEQSLILRHQTYLKNTLPIIEMYEQQGLVYKVNSMKTPDEVFQDVKEFFPKIGCLCTD
ncbi:PREDICTED: UMP-CMP kinase isoform X2 [Wasmannia auropunctata]|uniref:UMP-CMP kinase isoform X2 n=1 Tax=Wasmannia auropunctata TaxID=64793 RepID=UPI0005EE5EFB|nr:PREDICTED: UMP-CMP kinase isoform X2 [Wasmannia auropunctata]